MKNEVLNSQLLVHTNVKIEVFKDDDLVHLDEVRNLVPNSGRNILRNLLLRGAPGAGAGYAPNYIALGTDPAPTNDGSTNLGLETYRDKITVRRGYDSRAEFQLYLNTDQGNGTTYSEAGLFDSPQPGLGNMLARAVFTPVVKTSSIQLIVTWQINIASA